MSEQATAAVGPRTDSARNVVFRNPNASIALGSGSGFGALVVWVVGLGGAQVPPEVAAVMGGAIAAAFLLVGRRGIRGALIGLWCGEGQ